MKKLAAGGHTWSRQRWSLFPFFFGWVTRVQISHGPWSDQGGVPSSVAFLHVVTTETLSSYSWKKPAGGEPRMRLSFMDILVLFLMHPLPFFEGSLYGPQTCLYVANKC